MCLELAVYKYVLKKSNTISAVVKRLLKKTGIKSCAWKLIAT